MAARRQVLTHPTWPDRDGRPRVLVEARDGALRDAVGDALGDGYVVVDCPGPADGQVCPAVAGDRCATAAHADVVVCDVGAGDEHSRALPRAVARELREGASVIVAVTRPVAERHPEAFADCRVLLQPVHRAELRAAVAEAVDHLVDTPVHHVHGPRLAWSPPHLD